MKIILVVTDSKRKSIAFVTDELNAFSLEEAIQLALVGKFDGTHIVRSNRCTYLRTNPIVPKSDEIDTLSITATNLFLYAQGARLTDITSPVLKLFVQLYRDHLNKNEQLLKPVGQPEVLIENVRKKLEQHKPIIIDAATKYEIDPCLLGAILIDEIARLIPFESITDKILVLNTGINTSVGIAQVKTDTANEIIKLGLYNPNPDDPKLPFRRLNGASRAHLYTYLIVPKHSIFFAAADIKDIIISWKPLAGDKLTTAVIATLYSKSGKPHPDPESNDRGEQIADEFYYLAKEILK